MALASFDDFNWSDLLDPPITVVDQEIARIGGIAGERIMAALDGEEVQGELHRATLPILRVRASCGGPITRGSGQDGRREGP